MYGLQSADTQAFYAGHTSDRRRINKLVASFLPARFRLACATVARHSPKSGCLTALNFKRATLPFCRNSAVQVT